MKKIFLSFLVVLCVTSVKAQADSTMKEFTGRYIFPDGSVVTDVTVSLEGEELSMVSSVGVSALTKLGVDSFSVVEYSGTAVFKRGETNKINGVHIEAAGYILDGIKEGDTGWSYRLYLKPSEPIITKK